MSTLQPAWYSRAAEIVAPPRRDDLIEEAMDDDVLLVDPQSGHAHRLNATALFVWQRCDGQTTMRDIAEALATVADVDVETALDDVEQTIGVLVELGAIGAAIEQDQDAVSEHRAEDVRHNKRGPDTPAARKRDDTSDGVRHYRIGPVDVAVRSELPEAREDFERLYGVYRSAPGHNPILVEARGDARGMLGQRRYTIYGDGRRVFGPRRPREVFPYLEWGINWGVVQRCGRFLQLHAACLTDGHRTVLVAGGSGSGKSTLAAGLLSEAWSFYGDEFAMIHPATLEVHPFPKALCVKAGSFEIVRRLGLPLWRRAHYAKDFKGPVGYVDPHATPGGVAQVPRPISAIVFPTYTGATPRLEPMPRAEAAMNLARCTFNAGQFGSDHIPLISRVVRGATCWRLTSGELGATLKLFMSTI